MTAKAVRTAAVMPKPALGINPIGANPQASAAPQAVQELITILPGRNTPVVRGVQLTDSMLALLKVQPFYAVEYEGRGFDCGSKPGFLAANVAYALERPDLRDTVIAEIKKLL